MKQDIKDKIMKDLGSLDGNMIIATFTRDLPDLEVEFFDRGLQICINKLTKPQLNFIMKDLQFHSVTGRTFPIKIVDNFIQINTYTHTHTHTHIKEDGKSRFFPPKRERSGRINEELKVKCQDSLYSFNCTTTNPRKRDLLQKQINAILARPDIEINHIMGSVHCETIEVYVGKERFVVAAYQDKTSKSLSAEEFIEQVSEYLSEFTYRHKSLSKYQ